MKAFRFALVTAASALLAILPARLAAGTNLTVAPAEETVFVKVDSTSPIWFDHYRLAEKDASELILNTLKQTAADQARFAGYPGPVVVLDDDAKAPANAPVLLLTWKSEYDVNATLIRGSREKSLGVVSLRGLSTHPDYATMRKYLDKGPHDERRDVWLRAKTQMSLYQALEILNRYQAPG